MKAVSLLCFLLFSLYGYGQSAVQTSQNIRITNLVSGTLLKPDTENPVPLVILIGDSGPVDRNGNQPMLKNNSLRFLAEALFKNDIASFRYDKRLVRLIENRMLQEENLSFSDFIDDAIAVFNHFKSADNFSKIYIIGHGQGSLVGMVAAQEGADGFISIAGAGQEIGDVIVDQLAVQAPGLMDDARAAFDDLRTTGQSLNHHSGLASIFRKEIQPFLYTWMQYDPQEELKKLQMPILLITGDKDFQVQVSELHLLASANPNAQTVIIENMNHILKEVDNMGMENQRTYNNPSLPIIPKLIEVIVDFINK